MIVYNVTVGVDKTIAVDWLKWMREAHIPEVMRTGMFVQNRIFKVLTHEDPASESYAIQYFASSMENVNNYLAKFAPKLRKDVQDRFGDKQVAYRTLLEEC
jgi:hypothetical protein